MKTITKKVMKQLRELKPGETGVINGRRIMRVARNVISGGALYPDSIPVIDFDDDGIPFFNGWVAPTRVEVEYEEEILTWPDLLPGELFMFDGQSGIHRVHDTGAGYLCFGSGFINEAWRDLPVTRVKVVPLTEDEPTT